MKKERQGVLQKLMHKQEMGFNELWGNEGSSNGFAYHLKVLVEDGLVEKVGEKYCLSHEGKKYCTYVEGANGKRAKFPIVGVVIVIYNEEQDKYLFIRRTKEPFFGLWGLIGGKLNFNDYIYECAKNEIMEETGLSCDVEFKGLFSSKTYNGESLSYNHQMLILLATNPKGELLKKSREGENRWIELKEMGKLKMFPDVPKIIDIANGEGFGWVEMDRFQENDEFVGTKILRDEKLK